MSAKEERSTLTTRNLSRRGVLALLGGMTGMKG
jgi:hypothetical protein